ncbi:MAG: DUF1566 domain-containing protein, partial [Rhodoferax sp.]|nr:DUF1566 domain-containing protein [Rhodoferax sp.]
PRTGSLTNYDENYTGGTNINANTNSIGFVNSVNTSGLCGFTDWRMPIKDELFGIVTSQASGPQIDSLWFPHTQSAGYWTASPFVGSPANARAVYFNYGLDAWDPRSGLFLVRLVRGNP